MRLEESTVRCTCSFVCAVSLNTLIGWPTKMAGVNEEGSDNPFSFKSFLKRGEGGPSVENPKSSSKSTSSSRKKTTSKKSSASRDTDVVVGE